MTHTTAHDAAFERTMRRALELAANGPATGVNPRVGCVILNSAGDIIAEGWHRGAGTAHAEVEALSKLPVGGARGATVVVTLEPCNHTGRTGPCARALIDAGIARVVYAVADPGEHSAGGAERLNAAGIDVKGGLLADEAAAFLSDWLVAARLGRPFVTLKWASSLDGRAAAADGTSQWITGPEARQDVHLRRAASDAIVVGTGTVLADDPSLTARDADGRLLPTQPVPVVIGKRAIPDDAAIRAHPHPPIFFDTGDTEDTGDTGDTSDTRHTEVTGQTGVTRDTGHAGHAEETDRTGGTGRTGDTGNLVTVLRELHSRGIRRAFVEGGPTLASAFVAAGLVDEYLIYLAPTLIGGNRLALGDIGVSSINEQRRLSIEHIDRLGDDILVVAHPR